MKTIYTYSNEQAIEDGYKIRLGDDLFATLNLFEQVQPDGDRDIFAMRVEALMADYDAGIYCHPGSTQYPEETDRYFATYLMDGLKVWAMRDFDGLHLMLPEDY